MQENKSTEGAAQISAKNTTEDRKQAIQQSQMKAETEGTVIVQKTIRKGRYQRKKPKRNAKKFEPLVAAVIIMLLQSV